MPTAHPAYADAAELIKGYTDAIHRSRWRDNKPNESERPPTGALIAGVRRATRRPSTGPPSLPAPLSRGLNSFAAAGQIGFFRPAAPRRGF
jgi:hypothetical protein